MKFKFTPIADSTQSKLLIKRQWQRAPWSFLLSAVCVAVMTAIIHFSGAESNLPNIPMMYLLSVTAAALFFGSVPAVLASVLAFLAFDYFFVEPKFQFTVQNPGEWLALCVFLITSMLIGQLTALLRAQAEEARQRKSEATALAEASWAVATELDRDKALVKVVAELAQLIGPEYVTVILPDPADQKNGYVQVTEYWRAEQRSSSVKPAVSPDAVRFVLSEGRSIGWERGEQQQSAAENGAPPTMYVPVLLENQVLGVFCILLNKQISAGERQVFNSLLNHAVIILERDRLMKTEARAQALAEADKLKTALLSMISHDFRSPLTSIKASVSSLLEEGDPLESEVQKTLLQGVDQETDRLNRMVGNVLDLSRLESGVWRPRQETSEVAELVGSALDSFNQIENKRIEVKIDHSAQEVVADSVQTVQVVRNLLENALKYSPADSLVELNVTSKERQVVIEIIDRGGGLPKGEEQQIFEPFYRAPALKESSVPGVGIGLALCRGLVEANGGSLTAHNRDGGGAVFRVTLPNCVTPDLKSSSIQP